MSKQYPLEGGLLFHAGEPGRRRDPGRSAPLPAGRDRSGRPGGAVYPGPRPAVQLGPFIGLIPRQEAALGIREGTAGDRHSPPGWGKPIACTVTAAGRGSCCSPRRRAQELALARLLALPVGTILPAVVTHLEGFGAFVDVGCGVPSMIGIENCSVSRTLHPDRRFVPGQAIHALLTGQDPALGRSICPTRSCWGPGRRTPPGSHRG